MKAGLNKEYVNVHGDDEEVGNDLAEVGEEKALEGGFSCDECAEVYELSDNSGHVRDIKAKITRTEKDLYQLNYESLDAIDLSEENFKIIKDICKTNNVACPIYKWGGIIKFKPLEKNFLKLLEISRLMTKRYKLIIFLKKLLKDYQIKF